MPENCTKTNNQGLRGNSVILRQIDRSDIEHLRTFVNSPHVMQFSNTYSPISDIQQERWFDSITSNENLFWFGIEDVATCTNLLIGTCCLVNIDWIVRSAELRIRIGDPSSWGKGFGSEACKLLINYAYDILNLNRIWLRVFASNSRAIRMYENLGFQQEGRLRHAVYISGNTEDVILMGILRDEWKFEALKVAGNTP